jgi:aspartate carbamoyltransferase
MSHILTAAQFTSDDIHATFNLAKRLESASVRGRATHMIGKTLACVFYEPSTRTSSSFIAAMTKLGGGVIPITQGVQFSSVTKGETIEDTVVTLGQYADAIVLRHPEVGSVARAAAVSPVPVINAGDGIGEHPTQAMLDLYTIYQECGTLDGLTITFVGDLANGRTIHSLVQLLSRFDVRFNLVSPHLLRLGSQAAYGLDGKVDAEIFTKTGLHEAADVLRNSDVIYMTRVQKERFAHDYTYQEVKNSCLLTPELVAEMKPTARILHPFPRVNEIPTEIDADPRAAYFKQIKNGLYVRMALLMRTIGS